MSRFPNKMIEQAYKSAKGKVFTQRTTDQTFFDENGSDQYDHQALQWLFDRGVIQRNLNLDKLVFEYRVAK